MSWNILHILSQTTFKLFIVYFANHLISCLLFQVNPLMTHNTQTTSRPGLENSLTEKSRQSGGTRVLWNGDSRLSRKAHRNWLVSVRSAHPRSHKVPLAASMPLSTPVSMLPAWHLHVSLQQHPRRMCVPHQWKQPPCQWMTFQMYRSKKNCGPLRSRWPQFMLVRNGQPAAWTWWGMRGAKSRPGTCECSPTDDCTDYRQQRQGHLLYWDSLGMVSCRSTPSWLLPCEIKKQEPRPGQITNVILLWNT